jgi:hypothetical protein
MLGPGGPFRQLLDNLGLEDFKFVELDPDGFDRYLFPDYEFNFCKGREQIGLVETFQMKKRVFKDFLISLLSLTGQVSPIKWLEVVF